MNGNYLLTPGEKLGTAYHKSIASVFYNEIINVKFSGSVSVGVIGGYSQLFKVLAFVCPEPKMCIRDRSIFIRTKKLRYSRPSGICVPAFGELLHSLKYIDEIREKIIFVIRK